MGLVASVPDAGKFQAVPVERREIVGEDKIAPYKPLWVCWSLSGSQEFFGELPPMAHETKEQIRREAILFHQRDTDPRWKQLV